MTSHAPRLVTVAPAELDATTAYALWRLRQQVFVVEQHSPYPDLDGRDLEPATRHVLALDDDGPTAALLGCARLLDEGDHRRFGRLAVAATARGRGLGARLTEAALALCDRAPVRLDAQTGLTAFYGSYGFAVTGPEFDEDGVLHVPMARPGS